MFSIKSMKYRWIKLWPRGVLCPGLPLRIYSYSYLISAVLSKEVISQSSNRLQFWKYNKPIEHRIFDNWYSDFCFPFQSYLLLHSSFASWSKEIFVLLNSLALHVKVSIFIIIITMHKAVIWWNYIINRDGFFFAPQPPQMTP